MCYQAQLLSNVEMSETFRLVLRFPAKVEKRRKLWWVGCYFCVGFYLCIASASVSACPVIRFTARRGLLCVDGLETIWHCFFFIRGVNHTSLYLFFGPNLASGLSIWGAKVAGISEVLRNQAPKMYHTCTTFPRSIWGYLPILGPRWRPRIKLARSRIGVWSREPIHVGQNKDMGFLFIKKTVSFLKRVFTP